MSTQHIRGSTLLGATCCVRLATVLRCVAMCCYMLGVVGSSLKMLKFKPTTSNTSQHVCNRVAKRTQHVAPNNVAICCVGMLRSFGRGFRLNSSGISSLHDLIQCTVRLFSDWFHRKGGQKSARLSHSQMGESVCAVDKI